MKPGEFSTSSAIIDQAPLEEGCDPREIRRLVILAQRDADQFASLGELLDRAMETRAIRFTILVFWWWLDWHFLAS
ncbi:MAG: DUF6186 family protein [Microbacteriaceae bacterium]